MPLNETTYDSMAADLKNAKGMNEFYKSPEVRSITMGGRAIRSVGTNLNRMGLVSDGTADAMNKTAAVIRLTSGLISLYKGYSIALAAYRARQVALAAADTARTPAQYGPAAPVIIALATATSAGVGMALGSMAAKAQSRTTTKTMRGPSANTPLGTRNFRESIRGASV